MPSSRNTQIDPAAPRCPIDFALSLFGDRWSLLVMRNMALLGKRRYSEFLAAPEGISTNILANRLRSLQDCGLIQKYPDPVDRKAAIYLPTDKGLELMPILVEMLRWGSKNLANPMVTDEVTRALKGNTSPLLTRIERTIRAERAALQS
jgi:DNA-binding HxlR family transcriptional regulator